METCAITSPEWSPTVAAVEGRFTAASNATLLAQTSEGEPVIYKPIAGVRPLWDFEGATLALREVWTYRLDRALGFALVPETVIAHGPYGAGAVQRYVDGAADQIVVDRINASDESIWPVALLDVIVNNADRKAGHLLRDETDRLWAIDHGLTFHEEDKLRTVLWGFAGRAVPQLLLTALEGLLAELSGDLGSELATDLGDASLAATMQRTERLLADKRHPDPPEDRPAVPWPPY